MAAMETARSASVGGPPGRVVAFEYKASPPGSSLPVWEGWGGAEPDAEGAGIEGACGADEARLRAEGYLDPLFIRRRWNDHLAARQDWSNSLWPFLMFQAWLDNQHVRPSALEAFA